jgi:acetyltransferase-like isoleucine patch superfamily enzyme
VRLIRRNHRALTVHPYRGRANSLCDWYKVKNPLRFVWNYVLIELSKPMPSLAIKRALWRAAGAKVGKDVAIGLHAQLDMLFPELVEIGDNTIIGYNVTILAHEFLQNEWRTGKVKIGKGCMIGANSTILAGVTIGDNSTVSSMTLVNTNVPSRTWVEGVPARPVRR